MSTGARRILANTGYRLLADAGSKLASVAFYVVAARELGAEGFGVLTFGLAFVLLATTLGSFGQDSVLTREVARDKTLLDGYFVNTLALKLALCVVSLAIAIGAAVAFGIDAETRNVLLLLGPAATIELLMTTCFATFQAFERMEYTPVALISQRTLTALAGIAALLAVPRSSRSRRSTSSGRSLVSRWPSGCSCAGSRGLRSRCSPGAGSR